MPNGTNFELYIRIEDELMRVISQVGNTLNVVRAQYGTFAVAHGTEQTINFFIEFLEILSMFLYLFEFNRLTIWRRHTD